MRLTEMHFDSGLPVDGYGPGFFRIGGEVVEGPVLIRPDGVTGWGGMDDAVRLEELSGRIDVLFVGTGAETEHVPAALRARLEKAGIGVEAMATPPACRSYNVLLSEGRRIAAALMPV
ncbi:hypothetical protein DDZ14_01705 [Maritimibacter sp. 55A14]|uniref:Mth938-like domain-containing protein n=1 Tax=Maritimibacter sp. 55A14 TaxID=2174844 RepID=UPI000D61552A|nr:Mth938-like domain-containing protein [Maritimibacter sp. 55A14]PWE33910.1 hypothetical protein DDZ14_01705 [Maritimibacter sp. 55A14]